MASDLVYTSAERGIKPRSHGFCTVAMTRGLGAALVEKLEGLSGYREHYPASDPRAADNPVSYSYYRFTAAGRTWPVLSRVAFAGFDHTGRSNKLAHHVVLEAHECTVGGPAWVARHPKLFVRKWSGEPRLLESARKVLAPPRPAAVAAAWQRWAGDAGWAGVVAEHTVERPGAPVVIVYRAEQVVGAETALLELIDEAMSLVPPEMRWEVTFSTYLTDLPVGTTCRWRCVLAGSGDLERAQRNRDALVIDLSSGPAALGRAAGGKLVEAARTGEDLYPVPVETVALVGEPAGAAAASASSAAGAGAVGAAAGGWGWEAPAVEGHEDGDAAGGAGGADETLWRPRPTARRRSAVVHETVGMPPSRWVRWLVAAAVLAACMSPALVYFLWKKGVFRGSDGTDPAPAAPTAAASGAPAPHGGSDGPTSPDGTAANGAALDAALQQHLQLAADRLARDVPQTVSTTSRVRLPGVAALRDAGEQAVRSATVRWEVLEGAAQVVRDAQHGVDELAIRRAAAGGTVVVQVKVAQRQAEAAARVWLTVEDRRPAIESLSPAKASARPGETVRLTAKIDPASDDGPDERVELRWTLGGPDVETAMGKAPAGGPFDVALPSGARGEVRVTATAYDGRNFSDAAESLITIAGEAGPATRPGGAGDDGTSVAGTTGPATAPADDVRRVDLKFPGGRNVRPPAALAAAWRETGRFATFELRGSFSELLTSDVTVTGTADDPALAALLKKLKVTTDGPTRRLGAVTLVAEDEAFVAHTVLRVVPDLPAQTMTVETFTADAGPTLAWRLATGATIRFASRTGKAVGMLRFAVPGDLGAKLEDARKLVEETAAALRRAEEEHAAADRDVEARGRAVQALQQRLEERLAEIQASGQPARAKENAARVARTEADKALAPLAAALQEATTRLGRAEAVLREARRSAREATEAADRIAGIMARAEEAAERARKARLGAR